MRNFTEESAADDPIVRMYRRTLSHWVSDLLHCRPIVRWRKPGLTGDYRNRDWYQFYSGSVLDD